MACQASKGTSSDTHAISIDRLWQMTEVLGIGEHIRLCEPASVKGLIPPNKRAIEAALGAKHLFKGPEIVSMPDEEFWVVVHVGHEHLMDANKIFVSVRGGWEVSRGWLIH